MALTGLHPGERLTFLTHKRARQPRRRKSYFSGLTALPKRAFCGRRFVRSRRRPVVVEAIETRSVERPGRSNHDAVSVRLGRRSQRVFYERRDLARPHERRAHDDCDQREHLHDAARGAVRYRCDRCRHIRRENDGDGEQNAAARALRRPHVTASGGRCPARASARRKCGWYSKCGRSTNVWKSPPQSSSSAFPSSPMCVHHARSLG